MSAVIGTAKAAKWLELSEETVRRLCRTDKLAGAYQPGGYQGMWLVPVATLSAIRECPASLLTELQATRTAQAPVTAERVLN